MVEAEQEARVDPPPGPAALDVRAPVRLVPKAEKGQLKGSSKRARLQKDLDEAKEVLNEQGIETVHKAMPQ